MTDVGMMSTHPYLPHYWLCRGGSHLPTRWCGDKTENKAGIAKKDRKGGQTDGKDALLQINTDVEAVDGL